MASTNTKTPTSTSTSPSTKTPTPIKSSYKIRYATEKDANNLAKINATAFNFRDNIVTQNIFYPDVEESIVLSFMRLGALHKLQDPVLHVLAVEQSESDQVLGKSSGIGIVAYARWIIPFVLVTDSESVPGLGSGDYQDFKGSGDSTNYKNRISKEASQEVSRMMENPHLNKRMLQFFKDSIGEMKKKYMREDDICGLIHMHMHTYNCFTPWLMYIEKALIS